MLYAKITRSLTDTGQRKNMVTSPPAPDDLAPSKDYWVPVVDEVADTSTGPDSVVDPTVITVESDRLVRTSTTRDMTAQEIADRDASMDADLVERVTNVRGLDRAFAKAIRIIYNEALTANSKPTVTQNFVNQKLQDWAKEE